MLFPHNFLLKSAFLMLLSQAAMAAVTLQCVDGETNQNAGVLVIDIDAGTMKWGEYSDYSIISANETYVTGYQKPSKFNEKAGGEVFTINRVNGEYRRALVALFLDKKDDPTKIHLGATTFYGTCLKKQF